MGKRTSYEPGTFCWVDLTTPDVETAKRFYSELLGWEYDDQPAPVGAYSAARRYEAGIAALYEQQPQERELGLPPHWNSYVSTDDADRVAARVQELGGSVLVQPLDAMDAGRMAVITDPSGAMLRVWQPREHQGAGRVNDVGCLCWNELSTNDPKGAQDFYSALFAWRFEAMDAGDGPPYWVIGHDGAAEGRNGGLRALSPEETQASVPPNWMPYFTVESVDAAIETAEASSGALMAGPFDVLPGRIAVLQDPTGGVFGVFEGAVDD